MPSGTGANRLCAQSGRAKRSRVSVPATSSRCGRPLRHMRRHIFKAGPDHQSLARTANLWTLDECGGLWSTPRALIHNDFSPRNLALRQDARGFHLCAYDWELATLGPPQRDLAEFLCFVLSPNVSLQTAECFVERYRNQLQTAAGQPIPRDPWREGFRSALADLLIDKLAFYALVNRVRSQPFLPRVLRTWQQLYALFSQKVVA